MENGIKSIQKDSIDRGALTGRHSLSGHFPAVLAVLCGLLFMLVFAGRASAGDSALVQKTKGAPTPTPTPELYTGSCGTNANYRIVGGNNGYTLTISGTGKVSKIPYPATSSSEANKFKNNIRSIIIDEGITGLMDACFSGVKGVSYVSIPDTLTTIPGDAFRDCVNLGQIDLNKVSRIEHDAFTGTGLTSITFPATLLYLDGTAFEDCFRLKNFYCSSDSTTFKAVNGCLYSYSGKTLVLVPVAYESTTLTIPGTVQTIRESACATNSTITEIVIPSSVTEIKEYAFWYCSALRKVTINANCDLTEACFADCDHLKTVILGSGVKKIGIYAFAGCPEIDFPEIPDNVLYIDGEAFDFDISALVPDHMTQLSDGCYAVLDEVTIVAVEDYDRANTLFTLVNDARTQNNRSTLKMSASLCKTAMQRAAEIAVYYDEVNPIRPDGTALFYYSAGTAEECILKDVSSADVAAVLLKNDSKLLMSSMQSVGIGCVTSGNMTFWVVELRTATGTLTTYQSGTVSKNVTLSYAKHLSVNPSLSCEIAPKYIGEECVPVVYFQTEAGTRCQVLNDTVTFTPADSTIVSVDETGRLWALNEGTTNVTARLDKLFCSYNAVVYAKNGTAKANAVQTHACEIGDSFGILYYIPKSVYSTYDNGYLTVTCPVYDGNTLSGYRSDVLRDYEQVTEGGTEFHVYRFYGLAAKEMSSEVEAVFYGTKGTTLSKHEADRYSVARYASEMLASGSAGADLKKLLVDMISYGAEAQTYFEYHTNLLATGLIRDYLNNGTQTEASASDSKYEDNTNGGLQEFTIFGFSLSLENKPSLYFYIEGEKAPEYETAEITEKDNENSIRYYIIPASKWIDCGNNIYRVEVTGILAESMRNTYSVVLKKDGAAVSNDMTAGIEIYCAMARRMSLKATVLADKLLRFGDAVKAYTN